MDRAAPARRSISLLLTLLALLVAAVLAAALAGSASAAPSFRGCPDMIYKVNGVVYARTYVLQVRKATCLAARRVARDYIAGSEGAGPAPRPLGYRCRARGRIGYVCTKGPRVVRWRFSRP